MDLSGARVKADIFFQLTGAVEDGWDYLDVYFSADAGKNWAYQGSVTGNYADTWYSVNPSIDSDRSLQYRPSGYH